MKSVRTNIPYSQVGTFEAFLDIARLKNTKIGNYHHIDLKSVHSSYICYMYNDKDSETVATLTHLMLKYGNIDNAFKTFVHQVEQSMMNDTTAFEEL